MSECEHPAVTAFREYIRIKTVQPNPDYGEDNVVLCGFCISAQLDKHAIIVFASI